MANNSIDKYVPTAIPSGNGRHVLIIADNNVHDLELFYPYYRLTEAGFTVDVASPKGSEIKGKFGMGLKETMAVNEAEPQSYELLYIPGGGAPESLRKDEGVLKLVKGFIVQDKPVAAFCHGPQVLVSADVVKGKKLAAWPEVAREIEQAGGIFVDEPVVKDGPFITGRWPGDLPLHLNAVLEQLKGQKEKAANDPRPMKESA